MKARIDYDKSGERWLFALKDLTADQAASPLSVTRSGFSSAAEAQEAAVTQSKRIERWAKANIDELACREAAPFEIEIA